MTLAPKVLTGETLTRENFTNPPRELGILPFWFWNGRLDNDELEWQLREWKSKGIPGIFIHGRFGLKVPYVSDDWFEKVKVAVAKAKEIGIDAWVYDEMNWPSGTAERKVPTQYPHLTQRYLELVALQVDGPLFTFLEATDSRYVNTGNSHPVAAFGCTEEEYQNGITHPIDLTQNLSFDKVLPWEAPAGKWRLLYFLEKEVPYYIDALDPESTKRFLELTHDRYKEAVGSEFGGIVPGFFTDEPAMHYYQVGVDNYVVPWSKQMFKIFRQRRGYDLRPWLPALYANMGPKTAQVRYDFWRTLSEQYNESYYKQIRDWCDANGVIFTGHLLFEEWTRLHARCEGNIFKHLEQMHLTGVDHLYPKIGTEQEPDQHVALKIASSAAHHFGSARLICESMGGSYWDCTLERMKWILNWEYVLGVNIFNNHGGHYSIEGERKRDWPPSQFYQHTWWKYYNRFTEFATRLSHILSGGRHVAKVLVLYPITSIWANYVPQQRDAVGNVIEFDFNWLTDTLLRLHYDFDYVDEDVLAAATIDSGTITIREEVYSVLILPPTTHCKRTTFETVKTFVASGGSVIADTLLPVEFVETDTTAAVKDVRKLFGVDPDELLGQFQNGGSSAVTIAHRNSRGNVFVIGGKGLYQSKAKDKLRRILNKCVAPDVTISDEDVFYLHRVKDGFDCYFFVNTTQQDKGTVEITFETLRQPELWDPNTGVITPLYAYSMKNGRLSIQLDFPATEARIVVLSGSLNPTHVETTNLDIESFNGETLSGFAATGETVHATIVDGRGKRRTIRQQPRKPLRPISLGKEFPFSIEGDNVLAISKWKMAIDDGTGESKGCFQPEFDDRDWLDVTNGAWETQLLQERDQTIYPVTLWYRTSFMIDERPGAMRLLIDGFSGSEHTLYVNGCKVTNPGMRARLDAEMREINIHPLIRDGRNTVAVKLVVTRRTDGILDLLKIIGPFALRKDGVEYRIGALPSKLRVGDWTTQGFPFYSGSVAYSAIVEIPDRYFDGRLLLTVDCGEDVLEVRVNGHPGKVLPWHPYRLDITKLLRPGSNTIELIVTNTLINILEAVQKPSGIVSPPTIIHQHRHTVSVS
jgi:hypothetical protein